MENLHVREGKMKNLRAILFVIVLILGLPLVAAAAQQVEIVNPDGVVFSGDWWPVPSVECLNDWDGADPDASVASAIDYGSLTVDFEDPTGGPYTAIKVKLRARSLFGQTDLNVGIYSGGDEIGADSWDVTLDGPFANYSYEWADLNMSAADLEGLQVEIAITYFFDQMDISAIQVELVSEGTAPPKVSDPIPVKIDYRPFRNSNPLNYRSHGNVLVAIFGSADFNVRQIDLESLLLAGVAPVRGALRIGKIYSRTDGARDDYEDLVLMFKTQQVIQALEISCGRELKNVERVDLSLTGNLKDDSATPIEGQDTAVVFGKHRKDKKKGKWKDYWKWWKEKRHQREKD
jgi:hypothetical protein